jgi:cell division protein FtsQ
MVWLVAGLLAFGGGTWAAARSSLLDIDRIEVVGAFQVTSVQAAQAAGVRRGEPLVDIDEAAARTRLEALPWVRSARVERGFPNVVRINVEERLAFVSAARETGGYGLLDVTGRVLAEGPQRPEGLPEVVGAGSAPAPGAWMPAAKPVLDVVQALAEPLRRQVTQGSVADGSVTLRLGGTPGGVEVRFGPPDSLEAKADSLAPLLAHLGARPVAYIDVRVPGAPVVGPAGAASPAPAAPNRPAAARRAAPTKPVKPRD